MPQADNVPGQRAAIQVLLLEGQQEFPDFERARILKARSVLLHKSVELFEVSAVGLDGIFRKTSLHPEVAQKANNLLCPFVLHGFLGLLPNRRTDNQLDRTGTCMTGAGGRPQMGLGDGAYSRITIYKSETCKTNGLLKKDGCQPEKMVGGGHDPAAPAGNRQGM